MNFGEKLKKLRKERRLTQEETAEQIGISTRTYQNYESGRLFPQQNEVYVALSKLFEVSVDYLLFNSAPVTEERKYTTIEEHLEDFFRHTSQRERDRIFRLVWDLYWKYKKTGE